MDLENAVAGQTVPTADVSGERFARAQKATGQEKQQAQAPNPVSSLGSYGTTNSAVL
jgi:hypothetical protein